MKLEAGQAKISDTGEVLLMWGGQHKVLAENLLSFEDNESSWHFQPSSWFSKDEIREGIAATHPELADEIQRVQHGVYAVHQASLMSTSERLADYLWTALCCGKSLAHGERPLWAWTFDEGDDEVIGIGWFKVFTTEYWFAVDDEVVSSKILSKGIFRREYSKWQETVQTEFSVGAVEPRFFVGETDGSKTPDGLPAYTWHEAETA